ncbi:MAG TPA: hypothetical protein DCG57_07355 [Candidatus Riflebacteria bacterium]|jgi:hypothetical protein|nr:hypothetical protein [Candidatus Riflebacteria bacterium]
MVPYGFVIVSDGLPPSAINNNTTARKKSASSFEKQPKMQKGGFEPPVPFIKKHNSMTVGQVLASLPLQKGP